MRVITIALSFLVATVSADVVCPSAGSPCTGVGVCCRGAAGNDGGMVCINDHYGAFAPCEGTCDVSSHGLTCAKTKGSTATVGVRGQAQSSSN
jgi:hypothetical protein